MPSNIESKKRVRNGAWIPRALYSDPRLVEVSGLALAVLKDLMVWADADGQLTTPSGERFNCRRLAKLCRFEETEVDGAITELKVAGVVEVSRSSWRVLCGYGDRGVTERVRKHRAGKRVQTLVGVADEVDAAAPFLICDEVAALLGTTAGEVENMARRGEFLPWVYVKDIGQCWGARAVAEWIGQHRPGLTHG